MNAIAADFPELVGGSADLDPSTKTYLKGCGDFQPGQYAGRNIHFGVREHAMGGDRQRPRPARRHLPVHRDLLQLPRLHEAGGAARALNKSKVIFVFTHDSVFLGEDGPTHQPIEQLATLRATPNMTTIRPADALETLAAWKFAIAHDGPTALVLTRQKVPFLGERDVPLARGAYVLSGDDEPDVILIATGSEVSLAFDARVILQAQGIKTRVVSMPSMELFAAQNEAYRDSILPPAVRARFDRGRRDVRLAALGR